MMKGRQSHQLPLSLGGRYSSPTDSTFSPVTTAMITGDDRKMRPLQAMAARNLSRKEKEESREGKVEHQSMHVKTKTKQEEEELLSVIIPLQGAQKYKRSGSGSSLPALGATARSKLFSPTDAVFSPVSSNFYKSKGGKLQKMNARKAIFLRQNKK